MIVNDDEILFAKVKENAQIPSKKEEDAGYDFYACFEEDFFVIEALSTKAVPTGIATAFSKKYYAQVEERGSTGKVGMKKSSGVIDSGYRGEWFIMTYNANNKPLIISKVPAEELAETFEFNGKTYNKNEVVIYPYSKAICQVVMHVLPELKSKEVSYDEILKYESERGSSCLGASGK